MELNAWHGQHCDVVSLGNSLIADTVPEITIELDRLIQDSHEDILIDMSHVEELDSCGIGVLVYLYRRLKLEKRELIVLGLHGRPDELIRMLRVDQAIPRFGDYNEYLTYH